MINVVFFTPTLYKLLTYLLLSTPFRCLAVDTSTTFNNILLLYLRPFQLEPLQDNLRIHAGATPSKRAEDFVGALADGNQPFQIREKTLEFSSIVACTLTLHSSATY